MIALGLIETHGLVAAIEATDAMLKSANVYLLEKNTVGAGLVTITIAGEDVSSVSVAVEAGAHAVQRLFPAALISKHVIARPNLELHQVLSLCPLTKGLEKELPKEPHKKRRAELCAELCAETKEEKKEEITFVVETKTAQYDLTDLRSMPPAKLKELAKEIQDFPLQGNALAKASKERVIAEFAKIFK